MLAEPPAHRPARPAHPARQSAGEAPTRSAGGAESSTWPADRVRSDESTGDDPATAGENV